MKRLHLFVFFVQLVSQIDASQAQAQVVRIQRQQEQVIPWTTHVDGNGIYNELYAYSDRLQDQQRLKGQLDSLVQAGRVLARGFPKEDLADESSVHESISAEEWNQLRSRYSDGMLVALVLTRNISGQQTLSLYWGHSFNNFLVNQQQGVRRDPLSRGVIRLDDVHFFECNMGHEKFEYLCSLRALGSSDEWGTSLREKFAVNLGGRSNEDAVQYLHLYEQSRANYEDGAPIARALERGLDNEPRREAGVVPPVILPPAVPIYRPALAPSATIVQNQADSQDSKEVLMWSIRITLPIVLALSHGLLNNFLARRAGLGVKRWFFYEAPNNEWQAGSIAVIAHMLLCKNIIKNLKLDFPGGNGAAMRTPQHIISLGIWSAYCLIAGSMQNIGETVPLLGYKGFRRNTYIGESNLLTVAGFGLFAAGGWIGLFSL